LIAFTILALAVEPWGSTRPPPGPTPSPYRAVTTSANPVLPAGRTTGLPLAPRPYRPETFGPAPSTGEWSIRTSTGRVTPLPAMGLVDPADIASGPVVDLGPASELDVIALSGPSGVALDTIRLWRFDDRGHPERLDLARLAAPWPNVAAWAIGLRAPGAPAGRVAAWRPGLYRLDLLIEPAGRIRMVMLFVSDDGTEGGGAVARRTGDTDRLPLEAFGATILGRLPHEANLWTVGMILTGWARPPAAGDCRVAQIWRARGPEARCWAVPIGPTSALGVNLPAGQRVATIELTQVDPLPGPVALESLLAVGGRPGVAALETPAGGLTDGIYRLTVAVAGGVDAHWYVEVGPDGRRAAEINAYATGAQR
jgi:hypothetical protein